MGLQVPRRRIGPDSLPDVLLCTLTVVLAFDQVVPPLHSSNYRDA
ncbi:MAG: hypothetical protein U1E70_08455 [Acetobacteraceae bacterium]